MTAPSAPAVLGDDGRRLWGLVVAQYDLGPGEAQLLEAACFAYQRHQQAQALLDEEGVTVTSPQGSKANPAVAVADRTAQLLAKLLRQLRIELPPDAALRVVGGGGRPGTTRRRRSA